MELPHIGEFCSKKECKQLDFLPVVCDYCRQPFCKIHGSVSAHSCPKAPRAAAPASTGCAGEVPVSVYTHPDRTPPQKHVQTKKVLSAEQRQALEALKRTANKSAPRSRKQAAVSPKIELMRLKAKATGNESIGMSDRLYFSVLWQDKAIAVFINRNSGVGNAACRFSKQLHLSQLPDKIYRLRIPGTDKPLPSNKTFSELLSAEDSSGSLYNGCKLELIC
ncbi:AN1-type zinc finger protein 1 [Coemansia sp. RSA 1290]|nr:AN1-type zinc finger protein 1 [Coemansia sp. RSA 1290]